MLSFLHIENIAVVKCADIDFLRGFTALTGETGAGKSVIVDAIGIICGERVSADIIRSGEEMAVVEAVFSELSHEAITLLSEYGIEAEDGEVVLRGNVNSSGKVSVRANGRIVTRNVLRQISPVLISIHGQNDGKLIYSKSACLEMIDSYANDDAELSAYRQCYSELEDLRKKLISVSSDEAQKARERDMLEYQIKDIESKRLKPNEEELLEAELLRLSNIEKINKQTRLAYKALRGAENGSAVFLCSRASAALSSISDAEPQARELSDRLIEITYELEDIAERAQELSGDEDEDPTERIDKIEARLDAISSLKKRYGEDISAILSFCDSAHRRLDEIEMSDTLIVEYGEKMRSVEKRASELAIALGKQRKAAALEASDKILEILSFLDMPGVRFEIRVSDASELSSDGGNDIELMISTNPGEPLKNMNDIASGGELSRIVLALRCVLNEKSGASCSVYDEIDTGISGKTSRKIGMKLRDISATNQVICITHSAQVASLADNHYLISKNAESGRAVSQIKLLSYDERVEECARILGGIDISESQRWAARDMMREDKK